jgi:hypothetical protein
MTVDEFCARLASFAFVDRDMVPEISSARWPLFRDNPQAFFYAAATRAEREAIWRASDSVRASVAAAWQEYDAAGAPLPREVK